MNLPIMEKAMPTDKFFQSVEKSRLSDEVARQIERIIAEGRFLPGQKLPSERALSAKLAVSRPVLREALRILEIQGIVRIRQGSGIYVKDPTQDILNVPIREWLAENLPLLCKFYEARLVIEPECAALAAQRATASQIENLRILVEESLPTVEGNFITEFIGMDIDFHAAIAEMSGNTLLAQMLESIINRETDMRKIVLRLPGRFPNTFEGIIT